MNLRKILVLAGVVIFGALGDVALSRGMKEIGSVSLHNIPSLVSALFTPWVALGILLLIAFFASYLTSLSFADLTYVLPATSVGYILMALLARFFLHEHVSLTRWIGVVLIAAGVGFVASGPAKTVHHEPAHTAAGGER